MNHQTHIELLFCFISIDLQNPYMVLMDFDVRSVQSHAALLGFDAISTYALPGGTNDVNKYILFLRPCNYLFIREHHLLNYFTQLNGK